MSCPWNEEQAQRYVVGALEPEQAKAFAAHLPGCQLCQGRVAEAERVETWLHDELTPLRAPATLMAKLGGVTEAPRPTLWSRLFAGHGALRPVLAAAVLAVAVVAGSYAVAPSAVRAIAQKVLFFIPGLGIEPAAQDTLVAAEPVVVRDGTLTFTMEALLSDGEQTTVHYVLSGLPGGKEGWNEERGRGMPRLRDEAGREYTLAWGSYGVGGSAEENVVRGELRFAALPGSVRHAELIVPLDSLVPRIVLAGAETLELTVPIALVPPAQSGLPEATPQSASVAAHGVTLRVLGSSPAKGQLAILLEAQVEKPARLSTLGRSGSDPIEVATLVDQAGNAYALQPQPSEVTSVSDTLRRDLYFAALKPGAKQLTLTVPAVQVIEQGRASFTVSLNGKKAGDRWAIDQTVDLGGHTLRLKSATLAQEQGGLWLYVDCDPGGAVDGRTLVSLNATRAGGSSSMASLGNRQGTQIDQFGVPVDASMREVKIEINNPVVEVEGPWVLTFPVSGE